MSGNFHPEQLVIFTEIRTNGLEEELSAVHLKNSMFRKRVTSLVLALVFLGVSYGQGPAETDGKIYWSVWGIGILRSNLDGSDTEHVVSTDLRRPREIALDVGGGKIYWSDSGTGAIYRCSLDGSDPEPVVPSVGELTSVALDPVSGKVYWTEIFWHDDYVDGGILRANLDGTNVEPIIIERSVYPEHIALDTIGGKIYWTDWGLGRALLRSNLDGTDVEYDPFPGLITHRAVFALDVVGRKIYWTNAETSTIEGANLDGSNAEVLLTGVAGVAAYLALDADGGKIYWTTTEYDTKATTIYRADLDGANRETTVVGNLLYIALDLVAGKMYWTTTRGALVRSELDGSNIEDIFAPAVGDPYGFAVDVVGGKIYWTDSLAGTILRSDLDGSRSQVLITGLDDPGSISLMAGRKIYWVDKGTGKIQGADLNGSNVEDLVTGLAWVEGLALDAARAKIYWTEWDAIRRSDLDGSNIETLVTYTGSRSLALDTIRGKMYWASVRYPGTIHQSNLDGSHVEDLFDTGTGADSPPLGIAHDQVSNKIYWLGEFDDPVIPGPPTYTTIHRSDLDGSNLELVYLGGTGWGSRSQRHIAVINSSPTVVGLESLGAAVPLTGELGLNLPNPFNATTQIPYGLAAPGPVRLEIYNTLGQPVRTLVDQFQPAGWHQVQWDARDQQGAPVATGVYLSRLRSPDGIRTRRLLHLK